MEEYDNHQVSGARIHFNRATGIVVSTDVNIGHFSDTNSDITVKGYHLPTELSMHPTAGSAMAFGSSSGKISCEDRAITARFFNSIWRNFTPDYELIYGFLNEPETNMLGYQAQSRILTHPDDHTNYISVFYTASILGNEWSSFSCP